MGGSRAIGPYHQAEHQELHLEIHYLSFQNPKSHRLGQCEAVRQQPLQGVLLRFGIKTHNSSPGHRQANEQVEVTKRTILKTFKAKLEWLKGAWPEELPRFLWLYRTTCRTSTGESPFKLAFESEAVIPVEVRVTNLRTKCFHNEKNNEGLRLSLDLLDEFREEAALHNAVYQQRMARYYNATVKTRRFQPDNLVLRKVSLATRNPIEGKLGPNWEGPYRVISSNRADTYHLETMEGEAFPHPWNTEHLKKYFLPNQASST